MTQTSGDAVPADITRKPAPEGHGLRFFDLIRLLLTWPGD
jgi:hypothetical protein